MPSFSNCSAAFIPCQVEAILIKMRSLLMPASLYNPINLRALAIVFSVS